MVCLQPSILLWYAHVFTLGAFAGGALGLLMELRVITPIESRS